MRKPASVYKHYAVDGTILYVGCSQDLLQRHRAHSVSSAWWPQVARVTMLGPFPRDLALQLERALILVHNPRNNVAGTLRSGQVPSAYFHRPTGGVPRRRKMALRPWLQARVPAPPPPPAVTEEPTPWLTAQEAAEYSRLSIATVRRALGSGALKGVQGASSRWLIHRDQVDAWLIGETAA